jgi:hypothetical protein
MAANTAVGSGHGGRRELGAALRPFPSHDERTGKKEKKAKSVALASGSHKSATHGLSGPERLDGSHDWADRL